MPFLYVMQTLNYEQSKDEDYPLLVDILFITLFRYSDGHSALNSPVFHLQMF